MTWNPKWRADGHTIPKDRYVSLDFQRLEEERLWPRVWQMACRLEDVAEPGDYFVYEIADQSILIVRVDPHTIKAYHNVCRHRAARLAAGAGVFSDMEIVCPFHGWRWKLDGSSSYVQDRDEFKGGCLQDGDLALRECQTGTWLGCIFVNMDPGSRPLEDHVAPIRDYLDPLLVDQMRVHWHKTTVLAANWKVAQEAFMEGYHARQTHPQFDGHRNSLLSYRTYPHGHGTFDYGEADPEEAGGGEVLEEQIRFLKLMQQGMDAMVLARDVEVAESLRGTFQPPETSPSGALVAALYQDARRRGRPMPAPDPEVLARWGGECFVFPNYLVLPQFGNALVYRSRPNGRDPDSCLFDVWSLTLRGGEEESTRAMTTHLEPDDEEGWGVIPCQDFRNIPRVQQGLHSRACRAIWLADEQESIIANMHGELDRYLDERAQPDG